MWERLPVAICNLIIALFYFFAIFAIAVEPLAHFFPQAAFSNHFHYQVGSGHQMIFAQCKHGFADPGKGVQTGVVGDFKRPDIPPVSPDACLDQYLQG